MSQLERDVEIDEEVFQPGESNGTLIRLSLTAALGGFLFGYDSAVINGAVKAIGDQFSASSAVLGFTVSSALLGAAAGALAAGRVADRYGRLRAMWVAAALSSWFLAMTVPAVVYGGLALTIPESPRYLVSRGARERDPETRLNRSPEAKRSPQLAMEPHTRAPGSPPTAREIQASRPTPRALPHRTSWERRTS